MKPQKKNFTTEHTEKINLYKTTNNLEGTEGRKKKIFYVFDI